MGWLSNNMSALREYILERQELSTKDKDSLFLIYQDSPEMKDITLFIKDCFDNLLDPTIISIKITMHSIIIFRKKQDIQTYLHEKKYEVEKFNTHLMKPLESMYEKDEEDFLRLLRKSASKIEWMFDVLNRGELSQEDLRLVSLDIKKLNPHFIELINLFGPYPQSYRLYEKKYAYENLMWDWYHQSHPFFSVIEDFKAISEVQVPSIKSHIIQVATKSLKAEKNSAVDEHQSMVSIWQHIGQMIIQFDNFDMAADVVFQQVLKIYNQLEETQRTLLQYHQFDMHYHKVAFTDDKFSVELHTFDKVMEFLKLIARDLTVMAQNDYAEQTTLLKDQ